MKTTTKSSKPNDFLCDGHTSNLYFEVSILRHGQVILTALNTQYQPMENRPLLRNNAFTFFVISFDSFAFCPFFSFLHLSIIYSIFVYSLACWE